MHQSVYISWGSNRTNNLGTKYEYKMGIENAPPEQVQCHYLGRETTNLALKYLPTVRLTSIATCF